MGRHSAPDDARDGADAGGPAADPMSGGSAVDTIDVGRHVAPGGTAGSTAEVDPGLAAEIGPDLEVEAEYQTAPLRPLIADLGADADADADAELEAPVETVDMVDTVVSADTEVLTEVAPATETETTAATPADTAAPAKPASREGGTHADLRLLREQPGLRARCAAAVIVPFVLYTVAMLLIGRMDAYALWVWIPTVVAGVSVGSLLDLAHRREKRSAAATEPSAVEPGPEPSAPAPPAEPAPPADSAE